MGCSTSGGNIGVSRKQRVYVATESTCGELKFPVASTDFIRPAGNAVINQSPAFINSEELRNTLDVLDQFQDATPPASWTIPMYARPEGTGVTVGNLPQGGSLFKSMMGSINAATTAALASDGIADTTTGRLRFSTFSGGEFPEKGIIKVNQEYIKYTGLVQTSATNATGKLTGLTRAYASSTAAAHASPDLITLKSVFYKQDTDAPSISIWVETDHFCQAISGGSVNNVTLGVSNSGAVMFEFSGEGMRMYWAGTDTIASNATAGATSIVVTDADRFSTGMHIWNETANDYDALGSGKGYIISAKDTTTNTLTIADSGGNGIEKGWYADTSDVIKGWMGLEADALVIGDTIEGTDTTVEFNNVSTTFKSSDITFGVPKMYVSDEVGSSYPTAFVDDVRNIELSISLYFKQADARYFNEGYSGNEIPILFRFGNTDGQRMVLYLPRCKLTVPEISFASPVVELSMSATALGSGEGENSAELCFE